MQKVWERYKDLPVNNSAAANTSTVSQKPKLDPYLARIYMIPEGAKDRDELQQYIDEPVELDPYLDILEYWRRKRAIWPRLASMARDFLAPTASSASSERSNSNGKNMVTHNRWALSPAMMQISACLRSWSKSGILKTVAQRTPSRPSTSTAASASATEVLDQSGNSGN